MIYGILDRYVGRSVVLAILLCTLTLAGLSVLIKFVEQLRQVGEGNFDALHALLYVLMGLPQHLVMFFPMGALLGGVIGLGQLAQSSELVVLQAAGRSRLNIVAAVLKTVLPVMVLFLLLGEYGVPYTELKAKDFKAHALSGGQITASSYGVWARDGNDFVHVGVVYRDGSLAKVTRYQFDEGQDLKKVTRADSAHFEHGYWRLEQVEETRFSLPDAIRTVHLDSARWDSQLTPKKLGVVAISPDELSAKGLLDYVRYLKSNGQNADRYELALWRKAAAPLAVVAMMLLAASTVFGPLRSVSMGARIMMGVILGFLFYVVNEVLGPFSLVYDVPPVAGAFVPSLLFLVIAVKMLRRRA